MKVHAREPFSSGLRKPAQTMCGEFTRGTAPVTRYDPATRTMVEVSPGVPGDRIVETASVERKAEVTCEKCTSKLAREDDTPPIGESALP